MINFLKRFFQEKKIDIPEDAPDFIKVYLEKINSTQFIDNQMISDTRFVVFDTETTGLDVRKDKILSIGALAIENNQIIVQESFEIFILQEDIVGDEAIKVHGILKKGKKVKIEEREAIEYFVNFCKNSILVGHHVGFDIAMINQYLEKNHNVKLHNKMLDTGSLHQRVNRFESYQQYFVHEDMSLDAMAKNYNIETHDRHRALGDAYITAILFLKLIQKLKKRKVSTIGQLLKSI
jgi:DNA polymerase III subunit epsilon